MNQPTFHLTTAVGSAEMKQVFPTWSVEEVEEFLGEHTRHQTGKQSTWRWGDAWGIDLPLEYVNSSDVNLFRDWWRDQREVIITMQASLDAFSHTCRIVNEENPFPSVHQPDATQFQGTLMLRESNGQGKLDGGPFILDDATWGKLDQTYNVLV